MFDEAIQAADQECIPENNILQVSLSDASWYHDSLAEFLSDYRKADSASFERRVFAAVNGQRGLFRLRLELLGREFRTDISVSMPERRAIESVFGVFDKHALTSKLPEPKKEEKENSTADYFHRPRA